MVSFKICIPIWKADRSMQASVNAVLNLDQRNIMGLALPSFMNYIHSRLVNLNILSSYWLLFVSPKIDRDVLYLLSDATIIVN